VSTEEDRDPAVIRAHDLATLALGLLESIGPQARGVCVYRGLVQAIVRIELATDEALDAVAEDRGLRDRVIVMERRPAIWYRRASARWPDLWMVARGPNHPGAPMPDVAG